MAVIAILFAGNSNQTYMILACCCQSLPTTIHCAAIFWLFIREPDAKMRLIEQSMSCNITAWETVDRIGLTDQLFELCSSWTHARPQACGKFRSGLCHAQELGVRRQGHLRGANRHSIRSVQEGEYSHMGCTPYISKIGTFRQSGYHFQGPLGAGYTISHFRVLNRCVPANLLLFSPFDRKMFTDFVRLRWNAWKCKLMYRF